MRQIVSDEHMNKVKKLINDIKYNEEQDVKMIFKDIFKYLDKDLSDEDLKLLVDEHDMIIQKGWDRMIGENIVLGEVFGRGPNKDE